MKKPGYKHQPPLEVNCPPEFTKEKLALLSKLVSYRGSPDHKGYGNSFGFPNTPPRPDASVCDNGITPQVAQEWLRASICKGNIYFSLTLEKFPRYVWGKFDGKLYVARLINDGNGEYKGFPVQEPVKVKGLIE